MSLARKSCVVVLLLADNTHFSSLLGIAVLQEILLHLQKKIMSVGSTYTTTNFSSLFDSEWVNHETAVLLFSFVHSTLLQQNIVHVNKHNSLQFTL